MGDSRDSEENEDANDSLEPLPKSDESKPEKKKKKRSVSFSDSTGEDVQEQKEVRKRGVSFSHNLPENDAPTRPQKKGNIKQKSGKRNGDKSGRKGGDKKSRKPPTGGSQFDQKNQNVPKVPSNNKPDWYEELDDQQISMFKKLFDLLDRDGGGSIDAKELHNALQQLDIGVSISEIENVLADLDKDGNGEIDFDEFLFAMTTEKYIDLTGDLDTAASNQDKYSRRQSLFFTAITRFAIANSLGDVERYYADRLRKAPHVIGCYSAGARLIGLNEKQLEKEMKRLQKEAKGQDSPYAKPLPFVSMKKDKKERKKKPKKSRSCEVTAEDDDEMLRVFRGRERRRTTMLSDEVEIQQMLNELAERGNVLAKIPGIQLIPEIRTKIKKSGADPTAICSSIRKKKKNFGGKNGAGKGKYDEGPGWRIPKIMRGKVPLPVIRIKDTKKEFTIEDVHAIRKNVSKTLDDYYRTLKQAHIEASAMHWNLLHTEDIKSQYLLRLFSKVYRAYSPHKHEEVFAICPWIPSTEHAGSKPNKSLFSDPYGAKYLAGVAGRKARAKVAFA